MLPRRLRDLPRHRRGHLVVLEARGLRARLLGLALLRELPPGHALLIPRCRSVHTFGMLFALRLVWLGAEGQIVRLDPHVPPRRVRTCRGADAVLELPSTTAAPTDTVPRSGEPSP